MKTAKTVVLLLLGLFLFAPASWAETPTIDPFCLDSPEKCQKRAAKKEALRQRCAADPDWCKQWRANQMRIREERRALRRQCKANPDKCGEFRRQFKEKQAQRRKREQQKRKEARKKLRKAQKQWCTNNPTPCEQWKTEKREVDKKYQEQLRQLDKKYSRPHRQDG